MARRRSSEQTIFFPWERGGSFWRRRGARAKPIIAALSMAGILMLFGMQERERTGIRATRATLGLVGSAVDTYRADNEGNCPPSLFLLKDEGYLAIDPVDAWGRPLRLICPHRIEGDGYELMSDGPDGIIGGLDRIE